MPRLLIVGRGRMGTEVEALASHYGFELAAAIGRGNVEALEGVEADVAIDFTLAEAVPHNLPRLAARGINLVVGTTGWQAHEAALREVVAGAGVGIVAAANFSIGMNVFGLVVEDAARRFAALPDFGAWIHEAHHDRKKDAPSGTALALATALAEAGYSRAIDMSSTRAGFIPGTHTVGFDGPAENIQFTHTVRDRAVFAHGALMAARWIIGRRGWFGMRDVLEQRETPR